MSSVFFCVLVSPVGAANPTWDGGGTDETCGGNPGDGNKWSCDFNWSSDAEPSTADIAIFDGTNTKNASIDLPINVYGIDINVGYSGIITQSNGADVVVGVADYIQDTGTFTGGDATSDFTLAGSGAIFTLNGGTFTQPAGYMSVAGNITIGGGTFTADSTLEAQAYFDFNAGTFTAGDSLVKFTTGTTIVLTGGTSGSIISFNDVEVNMPNTGSFYPRENTIVTGTLTLTEGNLRDHSGGEGFLVEGDVVIGAGFGDYRDDYNAGQIVMSGSGIHTLYGNNTGYLPKLKFNKSGGIVNLNGTIRVLNELINTSGTINAGTSKVVMDTTVTGGSYAYITGGGPGEFYDFEINKIDSQRVLCRTGQIVVTHGLTLTEGGLDQTSSNCVYVEGNVTVQAGFGDYSDGYNDGQLHLTGSGTQTISGNGYLPYLWFDGSGTYVFSNNINTNGGVHYNSGTISQGGYKLAIKTCGSGAQHIYFYGGGATFGDFEINYADNFVVYITETSFVTGTLTLTKGNFYLNAGGIMFAQGDIFVASGFDSYSDGWNTGNLEISGGADQSITNAVGGYLPNLEIEKSGGTLTVVSDLYVSGTFHYNNAGGTIDWGANALIMKNAAAGKAGIFYGGEVTLFELVVDKTGTNPYITFYEAATISTLTLINGNMNYGDTTGISITGDTNVAATFGNGTAGLNDAYVKFTGSNTQTLTYAAGAELPRLTVDKTNSTDVVNVSGTGPVNLYEDFTLAKGIFDLNGISLTLESTSTFTNNATLRLYGNETVIFGEASGFDENSGIVEFDGASTYVGLPAGFGNYFYNLLLNNVLGNWQLDANLRVDATLSVGAGTLTQGAYELRAVGVTVGANGVWNNVSTGDILVGVGNISNSGTVTFKANDGCGSTDEISITAISGTPSWGGSGAYTMYDVSVASQNATPTINVYSGNNVGGNTGNWVFNDNCPGGDLTCDIIDGDGNSVTNPSLSLENKGFSFSYQVSSGIFGTSIEKMRITNGTANSEWNITLAANGGPTSYWDGSISDYDYNDPVSEAGDGTDSDSLGGQMTVNPSLGIITPQLGCTNTGLLLGDISSYNEETGINSATILTASGTTQTNCYWDLTGVAISQSIPAEQSPANYSISMTLTVTAI